MSMSKEKFQEIKQRYNSLLMDDDISNALDFVHDLLCAEADAVKASEPYATNTIKRLEDAAYEVFEIAQEVMEWMV